MGAADRHEAPALRGGRHPPYALLPCSPLRRQCQASSSSPTRGTAPSPRGSLPQSGPTILGPAEGWVCPCNSLGTAITGMYWVTPVPSPACLLASSWGLSDKPSMPSTVTCGRQISLAQLPGIHSVFTCRLHARLGEVADMPPFTAALPDTTSLARLVRLSFFF